MHDKRSKRHYGTTGCLFDDPLVIRSIFHAPEVMSAEPESIPLTDPGITFPGRSRRRAGGKIHLSQKIKLDCAQRRPMHAFLKRRQFSRGDRRVPLLSRFTRVVKHSERHANLWRQRALAVVIFFAHRHVLLAAQAQTPGGFVRNQY